MSITDPDCRGKLLFKVLPDRHSKGRSGKSKARFFASHGYAIERWGELAEAVRMHARENQVVKEETTALGVRLVVEGPMTLRRSVWFIESGERVPRLATAYPLRQRKRV